MSIFSALLISFTLLIPNLSFGKGHPRVKAPETLAKQLKIMTIGEGQIQESFRLPARVELDQQHVARIGASVTGRIIQTTALLGQDVNKGEQLAMLNSNELAEAQSAFLKTSSQAELRQLIVNRAQRLLDNGVIATANIQERTAALEEAKIDLRTATDHLRALGMSNNELSALSKHKTIHSMLPITASIQGTIVERNVTVGQVIQPADALFTIANLSHVWIVAELPEQQSSWAHEGDAAEVSIAALPDANLTGKLDYVAEMINPSTRTLTVRINLPNPLGNLKPNMLATLTIRKQGIQELILPDSAVTRLNNTDHVFKLLDDNEYELIPVELGPRHDNVRPIIKGLHVGDKVVIEGGFHLNNELQSKKTD